ncbi:MAG: methyl-accepting chemotaxis protein, partial [Defluviitaleaceae bacterium]|nr:methyl-accepting chemotaxis protein [Defluviitaleaceae bacterium]
RDQFLDIVVYFEDTHEFIESIWVAMADGGFYDSGLWVPPEGFVSQERPWWITAEAARGATHITPPYIAAHTGGLVATIVRYIPDLHGQQAVVSMNIELDMLEYMISSFEARSAGRVILLGADSEIIVHPEERFLPTGDGLQDLSAIPNYSQILSRIRASEHVVLDTDQYGAAAYFMHFPLESTGWSLLSVVPATITSAPVWRVLGVVMGTITITLMIVAVFIVIFMSAQIKQTVNTSVSSFNARSMALATGQSSSRNLSPDTSFGLSAIDTEFNHNLDIIENLIRDIETMHNAHLHGNFRYLADSRRYEGAYAKIVNGINEMVSQHTNSKTEILECISGIVSGNFKARIREYPGDERYINDSVEGLRTGIISIAAAISKIAVKAQHGEVNFSLNAKAYKGEWVQLVEELNGIMTAISKPLNETTRVLSALKKGDFSQRVEGDFSGEFLTIKNTLNTTSDAISSYITEINTVLGHLSQGDLRNSIDRSYVGMFATIKDSINTISEQLNSIMSDIQTSCSQVLMGAEQISHSSMQLADGASKQTTAIRDLSNSISVIHEKATQANNDAAEATETTLRSQNHAKLGTDKVRSMATTMHKVQESSESISKIISVITSIAFQTNLLALNASVEAARAGEHGKGFAVVAGEVRNLAGRSQQSASDTTAIIGEDTKNVQEGIKATEEVVASFETITTNIGEIADLIGHIAHISGEQLSSITSINSSVSEITRVITDTSATAQESASASEQLNSQVELLKQKVSFFKLKK